MAGRAGGGGGTGGGGEGDGGTGGASDDAQQLAAPADGKFVDDDGDELQDDESDAEDEESDAEDEESLLQLEGVKLGDKVTSPRLPVIPRPPQYFSPQHRPPPPS